MANLAITNFGYSDNAGGWRVDAHPRFVEYVNGDDIPDIVGFGNDGVWVSLGNGDGTFQESVLAVNNLGYSDNAGGWRVDAHPRSVEYVNGDDIADIVGFGNDGVWVSLGNGDGTFQESVLAVNNFGYSDNAGGWRVDAHPRFAEDVNRDDIADIVGFGNDGVWVSLGNGDGTFQESVLAVNNFGYSDNAGGWRVDAHPRFAEDVTGDFIADIVGFGNDGVWVSLGNGDGTFQESVLAVNNFGYSDNAGGWRVDTHPRFVEDVTGDFIADIVGFGNDGVWVSVNNGDGTFQESVLAVNNFGYSDNAGGWRVDAHPRSVEYFNEDSIADIVGFGNDGVWVSLGNGDGTFQESVLAVNNFGYSDNAGGWRVDAHPRFVEDVTTGDFIADIVGFGNDGVWVETWL